VTCPPTFLDHRRGFLDRGIRTILSCVSVFGLRFGGPPAHKPSLGCSAVMRGIFWSRRKCTRHRRLIHLMGNARQSPRLSVGDLVVVVGGLPQKSFSEATRYLTSPNRQADDGHVTCICGGIIYGRSFSVDGVVRPAISHNPLFDMEEHVRSHSGVLRQRFTSSLQTHCNFLSQQR
jgi:hypothetical protein